MPVEDPVDPSRRISPRTLGFIAGGVGAALVVGLVLAFVVFRPADTTVVLGPGRTVTVTATTSSGGAPTAPVTLPPTTPAQPTTDPTSVPPTTTTATATTSSTTTAPAYPPVALTGAQCGTAGAGAYANFARGNAVTSCPFAQAVQAAFEGSGEAQGATLSVTSPTTGKAYPMTCAGGQPVTCTGGNNAVVYLYGGTATFSG